MATPPDLGAPWSMPLEAEAYERDPELSPDERAALAVITSRKRVIVDHAYLRARQALVRLTTPLEAVHTLSGKDVNGLYAARRVLYAEMLRRDSAFWVWTAADWLETCGSSPQSFRSRYPALSVGHGRHHLLLLAYLLGGVHDLQPFGLSQSCVPLARTIFGTERVEVALERVAGALYGSQGLGYQHRPDKYTQLRRALCQVLLLNLSPHLEAIPAVLIERLAAESRGSLAQFLRQLGRALDVLGLVPWSDPPRGDRGRHWADEGVPPVWAAWSWAWYERQVDLDVQARTVVLHALFAVGRWLRDTHPTILTPEQWDEDLALEYVQYISTTALTGHDASPGAQREVARRGLLDRPFRPRTIEGRLSALRRAFSDWQDRPHVVDGMAARTIPIRFKPHHAFATPRHIKALIRPDPRDIDLGTWYKLAYAAATLTDEHLVQHGYHYYPPTLYRAVALLWVTAARRPDELRRLRVGCVRRDWDPTMLGPDGHPLDRAAEPLCYLQVPSNKTSGPFWIWIPTYTADAIAAWEQGRPAHQAPQIDPKDRTPVDYLFLVRNHTLSKRFLNDSLIPLLCSVARVPEADARGQITAHRGRSTRATLLRRLGVSLADIAAYLGHATEEMVRHYARTDDTQLALTIKRADERSRLVEGLIDVPAAQEGRPNVFFFLGSGPDGKPRYCGNPAWASCPHRLACLKCRMYVGGEAAELLAVREGVLRFQTQVPMTPVEQAAAEGDVVRLRERLADLQGLPVPEPPSDAFVFNHPDISPPLPMPSRSTPEGDRRGFWLERQAQVRRDLATARDAGKRTILVKALEQQLRTIEAELTALERADTAPAADDAPPEQEKGQASATGGTVGAP